MLIIQYNRLGEARGSVVDRGTMLQAGKPRARFHMKSLDFLEPLSEMSTRNLPGVKSGRRVLGAYCLGNVVFSTSHNPIGLHNL
jgi:hypothetical protein